MKLLDYIKVGLKVARGIRNAAKQAYNWLKDELIDNNSPGSSNKVQRVSGYLMPGKIHVFTYTPKTADRLAYYDKHPVVLCLGQRKLKEGVVDVGINIAWYPPKARQYIVSKIYDLYENQIDRATYKNEDNAKTQAKIQMDLDFLKAKLDHLGFSFAIRQYYPHLRGDTHAICYEEWDQAIQMDVMDLESEHSITEIYQMFEEYVKNMNI